MTVIQADNHQEHDLIDLRTASRMLGVKGPTLRNWANRGLVRTVRTPGGHRRFFREEIRSMSERSAPPMMAELQQWEDLASKRIQQRIRQHSQEQHDWHGALSQDELVRLRLFGRRVLSLMARSASEGVARKPIMQEARLLGRNKGMEIFSHKRSLIDALSAFLLCRNGALETLPLESQRQALAVADQIMLGVAEAHRDWVEKDS